MPIVVLLMILYYVILNDFDISAVIVAIIGFPLNLGAYSSEIFRTAIDAVDKGQTDAASAIGFSKFNVFSRIIFPQIALLNMLEKKTDPKRRKRKLKGVVLK